MPQPCAPRPLPWHQYSGRPNAHPLKTCLHVVQDGQMARVSSPPAECAAQMASHCVCSKRDDTQMTLQVGCLRPEGPPSSTLDESSGDIHPASTEMSCPDQHRGSWEDCRQSKANYRYHNPGLVAVVHERMPKLPAVPFRALGRGILDKTPTSPLSLCSQPSVPCTRCDTCGRKHWSG